MSSARIIKSNLLSISFSLSLSLNIFVRFQSSSSRVSDDSLALLLISFYISFLLAFFNLFNLYICFCSLSWFCFLFFPKKYNQALKQSTTTMIKYTNILHITYIILHILLPHIGIHIYISTEIFHIYITKI